MPKKPSLLIVDHAHACFHRFVQVFLENNPDNA